MFSVAIMKHLKVLYKEKKVDLSYSFEYSGILCEHFLRSTEAPAMTPEMTMSYDRWHQDKNACEKAKITGR